MSGQRGAPCGGGGGGGLLENRDLKPTIDVRGVLKGLLKDHLRANDHALVADVFPGSDDVKPMAGLLASV